MGFAAKWQRPTLEKLASEGKKTGGEYLGRTRKRGSKRAMGDGVARRGERRDVQLRSVESHCGMGFSMQFCQQMGS